MNPAISIIIPCYNSSAYLERCLSSVMRSAKSYMVEILLIDDGSEDDTRSIMLNYAKKDSRFHVFKKANGGYCSAINYGLRNIKGSYVMMLGSDDEIGPELIAQLLTATENAKPDIVCFKAACIHDPSETLVNDAVTDFPSPIALNGPILRWDVRLSSWTKMLFKRDTGKLFKASLIHGLQYEGKYGIYSDDIFSATAALTGRSFVFLSYIGYIIHRRTNSISSPATMNTEKLLDQAAVLSSFWNRFISFCAQDSRYVPKSPSLLRFVNVWSNLSIFTLKVTGTHSLKSQSILSLWGIMPRNIKKCVPVKNRVILSFPTFMIPFLRWRQNLNNSRARSINVSL